MQIVYAKENMPQEVSSSIFLAGPTPRSVVDPSWRPEAIQFLREKGFDGVVYIPEPRDGMWDGSGDAYQDQVDWEWRCLNAADVILFWIPRDMGKFPGLTTNVEFGMFLNSSKVVLGAPDSAVKMAYLKHHYHASTGRHCNSFLHHTIDTALSLIDSFGGPSKRTGTEVQIPLHIWNTNSFQSWYQDTILYAGNKLQGVTVEWCFRKGGFTAWVLKPSIWIESEARTMDWEFVVSRNDISSILLYTRKENFLDSEVLLIHEFRAPVRNANGIVTSLPGGSGDVADPKLMAVEELEEEVGFVVDPERVQFLMARQDNPTFSTNYTYLYAVEVTSDEMDSLRVDDKTHGVEAEQIKLSVKTIQECLDDSSLSWATLGMLLQAIS